MRLAVIAAFAAVLVGCGSATGSSLEDAADATAAETSRFEYRFSFGATKEHKEVEINAAGVFDYPNERGIMKVGGWSGFFGDDVLLKELRLIGRTGYLQWVVKGKTYWMKEEDEVETGNDPTELLIPFPGSPTKPTDVLTRVLLASDENEEVGTEEVRGAETTHYRARVDLKKLVKQLPAAERPEGDVVQLWGSRFVPVEIWIDDESRLRRITIEQREHEEDGNPAMTTTVELFDYGVEVDVQPPTEDLISQEQFDKLTAGSSMGLEAGEASGKGELVAPEEVCESARQELPKKEADRICSELKENP
jgi:hypothetical protein